MKQKRASYLNHSAQPSTLAAFPPWGNSRGATCLRLALCKDTILCVCEPCLCLEILLKYPIKKSLIKFEKGLISLLYKKRLAHEQVMSHAN